MRIFPLDMPVRSGIRCATMGTEKKNPHAVALGRKGGLKGGKARVENQTPEERSESARHAANVRWGRGLTRTRLTDLGKRVLEEQKTRGELVTCPACLDTPVARDTCELCFGLGVLPPKIARGFEGPGPKESD